MSKKPRGIRGNNPGNIERGALWKGLASEEEIPEHLLGEMRFAIFRAPHWGIRAIARILRTYKIRHEIDTIAGLINRWAPPNENDTAAYVHYVSQHSGICPDEAVDLEDYGPLSKIIPAIIAFENGQQPYHADTIERGLEAAGVRVPARFMA